MSWLLGLSDAVLPGAGLFVLFDCLLVYGALLGLLWLSPARSWLAPAVTLALLATPQFLIYPAIVWKDVLFAAASVAGFTCLALAAGWWPRRKLRHGLIGAGFVLFVLAGLARQNGILMLLFGAAALGWIGYRLETARIGAAYAGASLIGSLMLVVAGHAALALRVRGDMGPAAQIRLLQAYDLIGALERAPTLSLPGLSRADARLVRLMRTDGVRLYSPVRNDTLAASPQLLDAIGTVPPSALAADWRRLVLRHAWLYAETRWAAFRWVFLTPTLSTCYPYYLGLDGPPAMMKALGFRRRWDRRDQALAGYAAHFAPTPILRHEFYAGVAIVVLALLLRRGRPADIAMAALLGAMLAFTASFFVISISCDYRYLYALDLAVLVSCFYLALDPSGGAVYGSFRVPVAQQDRARDS